MTDYKVHDLTISKKYDDSGTNAILRKASYADDVYYGMKVHLENVPENMQSQVSVDGYFSPMDGNSF